MGTEKLEAYLKQIDEVIEQGEYKDDWKTLVNHKVPDWYRDAKFGIFIHWGPYSVPAFGNEWYSKFMYKKGAMRNDKSYYDHHIETYGPHKEFGYKDFIPMFKAEKFDPKAWADLFEEAGAKFVMPVAEHHDGFQMYDSDLSEWCASKMGPKQDTFGRIKEEIEKKGMVITASSHRAEHYWFMCGGKEFESDMPQDIPYGHLYWPSMKEPFDTTPSLMEHRKVDVEVDELFMQDWLARTCEIVDKYRPGIMYFDWWIHVEPMKPYLKKFMAYYYNRAKEWGIEVTINYKNDAFMHTSAVRDIERGQLADVSPYFWQNDTSVAKYSWCYTEGNDYKKPNDVICDLIDVVSKNGSLLLNVGPKADGTIPDEDAHILREVGKWMKANGEAIYASYPWRQYGEGPLKTVEGHHTDMLRKEYSSEDFRFTFKDGNLYVFVMKWPEDGTVKVKCLGRKVYRFNAIVEKATVLDGMINCEHILHDDCLELRADAVDGTYPVCIKLETN